MNFSPSMKNEMSDSWDGGAAEPVSRDQFLRRGPQGKGERGYGKEKTVPLHD